MKSDLELVRLVGALRAQNPECELLFRGEARDWPAAPPSRYRSNIHAANDRLPAAITWLKGIPRLDRALRDRGPLARVAILQHYGIETSMVDVSTSLSTACAFAFDTLEPGVSHLRVFAVPRRKRSIEDIGALDVVVVDLRAELPSYCLRPHAQEAVMLARRGAILRDVEGSPKSADWGLPDASVDDLSIARIRLDFHGEGRRRYLIPRLVSGTYYPPPSTSCTECPNKTSDMSGDYLLHLLRHLASKYGGPPNFPDQNAEAAAEKAKNYAP